MVSPRGGEVKGKKNKKEETELQEKELSVDDQMRISREAAAKENHIKMGIIKELALSNSKNAAKKKDTRTDAQKMTDATGLLALVLATEVTSD